MATLYSPSRAFRVMFLAWLRRLRCPHVAWTPLDGPCPDCGKEIG